VLVDDVAVVAVLARADERGNLPRLGGMARPDGVAIVSERWWCFSGVAAGAGPIRPMPQPTLRFARLPFARGLVKLAATLAPLVGRNSTARPWERLMLVATLLAPIALLVVPSGYRAGVGAGVAGSLVLWMLRGRTLWLHGAEHRAIAAAETCSLVATWNGETRPSRFSPRCGTNFAALLVPVSLLLDRAWILPTATVTPLLVTLVALMVTMEIWLVVQRSSSRAVRALVLPGMLLQRLTTREPRLDETRVALRAVAAVLVAHE
jgi:hypothetical protein